MGRISKNAAGQGWEVDAVAAGGGEEGGEADAVGDVWVWNGFEEGEMCED